MILAAYISTDYLKAAPSEIIFRKSADTASHLTGIVRSWLEGRNRMVLQIALIEKLQHLHSFVEAVGNVDTIVLVNTDPLRDLESAAPYIAGAN